jgi:hypothetical protein
MSAQMLAMEEHHHAYLAWKGQGKRKMWCWHVDAHLDLSDEGLTAPILESWAKGEGPYGNAFLPWGGLNCGNYLLPAIREGLLGRLTWVLPDWLPHGDLLSWSRQHLLSWLDLKVEEWEGLRDAGGYVEGLLLGIPFQMGILDNLPRPDQEVWLDVDLDYYVDGQGNCWLEPDPTALPKSCLTTLAFSVVGGFLPDQQRSLAEAFGVSSQGYQSQVLDRAACLWRQGQHQAVLELDLSQWPEVGPYLRGSCLFQVGQHQQALQEWSQLKPSDSWGQAYLAGLAAQAWCALGEPQRALEQLLPHQGQDPRLEWTVATAHEQLGQLRQATQTLRRLQRSCADTLFGQQVSFALQQLYLKQGKLGLAQLQSTTLKHLPDSPFRGLPRGCLGAS